MSISVKAAIKLIAQNAQNAKFKVIDVRTAPERAASSIPNSHHIPLANLEASMGQLSREETYLIYCRSGKRSADATSFLNSRGFKAINM